MEDNQQKWEAEAAGDESPVRADEPKTCANCGKRIDTSEWHPLATRVDDDGNFTVYAFCSDRCRDELASNDADNTGGEA